MATAMAFKLCTSFTGRRLLDPISLPLRSRRPGFARAARAPVRGPEGRVMNRMSEVIIGDGESFEAALRRFNKKIQQAGILAEARRREYYERPAARRKRKEAKRRKR